MKPTQTSPTSISSLVKPRPTSRSRIIRLAMVSPILWTSTNSSTTSAPSRVKKSLSGETKASTSSAMPRLGVGSRCRRSEEHTSELQSLMRISYAVFCLKKKKKNNTIRHSKYNSNNDIQQQKITQNTIDLGLITTNIKYDN